MATATAKATTIDTTIRIPRDVLKAALLCASRDETRAQLGGVHVEADDDGAVLVSTDGHRLLVVRLPGRYLPAKITLATHSCEAAVKVAKKRDEISVAFDTQEGGGLEGGHVDGGVVETSKGEFSPLRLRLVGGQFPDWRQVDVLADAKGEVNGVAINGRFLADAGKVARLLADDKDAAVTVTSGADRFSPVRVDFPTAAGVDAHMVVMPLRL